MMKQLLILVLFVFLTACESNGTLRPSAPATSAHKASEVNVKLGANYLQKGQYQAANAKLEKALRQNPNSAAAHNVMAALQQQLGANEQAEHHYQKSISLAPNYSEAHNNYGVFLCQQGRYRAAEAEFLTALENPLYSAAAGAYENAGLCVQKLPDLVQAEDYFNKALRISPYQHKSLMALGNIYYDKGDYLAARDYLVRYKKIIQYSPQSLLLGIKVSEKMGDADAAASYLLLLRSQYPDSDEDIAARQGQY